MPDFLFSLPLRNPCVRGDGVGYDVLPVRPLIEHSLDFTPRLSIRESQFSRSAQQRDVPSPGDFQHRIGGIEGRKVATASAD